MLPTVRIMYSRAALVHQIIIATMVIDVETIIENTKVDGIATRIAIIAAMMTTTIIIAVDTIVMVTITAGRVTVVVETVLLTEMIGRMVVAARVDDGIMMNVNDHHRPIGEIHWLMMCRKTNMTGVESGVAVKRKVAAERKGRGVIAAVVLDRPLVDHRKNFMVISKVFVGMLFRVRSTTTVHGIHLTGTNLRFRIYQLFAFSFNISQDSSLALFKR